MAVRVFPCASCGHEVRTRYAVQKVCELCAIVRAYNWGIRPRPCEDCGKEFFPLKSSYVRCADCHPVVTGTAKTWPTCPECGLANRTPPGWSGACLGCVESTAINRTRYLTVVRAIVRTRQRKFSGAPGGPGDPPVGVPPAE